MKIARWYDSALKHVDYAIASAQQALQLDNAHVGALTALEDFFRKQKRWSDLVSALARHAEVEQETQPRVDILLQLADTYETQIGDAAQAMFAYQRALDGDERCIDAINALERLYRRTQAWDRLVEVLSKKSQVVDDTEFAVRLKLQVGELWEDRLGDNERAVEAYKEVLAVDPQNLAALKALDSLYEKTGRMEEYLENLEHQLEISSPEGDRVEIYQRMAALWEEEFGKPDRAAEVLEKILLIDDRNQKAYRDLERLYQQERKWESLVDTYRKHILATNDAKDRIALYTKMGQVYETELRDLDRAIDAYSDVLNVEMDHIDALAGLARLYEETEQWDRAIEMMRRLLRVSDRPEAEGRPQLPPRQDLRRADEGAGARPGVPGRGAVAGSVARAVDAVAARHLQEARRLAEGGPADDPRRGEHGEPAREDAAAVRRREDLPGEAQRRRRRPRTCSRA